MKFLVFKNIKLK